MSTAKKLTEMSQKPFEKENHQNTRQDIFSQNSWKTVRKFSSNFCETIEKRGDNKIFAKSQKRFQASVKVNYVCSSATKRS